MKDDQAPRWKMPSARTGCVQCGTCCKKGGPALHFQDLDILKKGVLRPGHLFTLRKGEKVFENVKGAVAPLENEMIKIKGRSGKWTCYFFSEETSGCRIYEDRPVECRALACWDTRAIEALYDRGRLTRLDLVAPDDAVRKLISAHDERCSCQELSYWVSRLADDEENGETAILNMISYDAEMRPLLVEKAGLNPDHLDFLFGRPLSVVLEGFGLKLKNIRGRISLAPAGAE